MGKLPRPRARGVREVTTKNQRVVEQALEGTRGEGAKKIAFEGLGLVATLLRKNADYGSSAWNSPLLAPGVTAREAIQTRLSDKISRLAKLLNGNKAEVEEAIEDTMLDLAGYALLWLTCPQEGEKKHNDVTVEVLPRQLPTEKRSIIHGHEYTCLNGKDTGPMVYFKQLPDGQHTYYSKNQSSVDWFQDGTPRRVNMSMAESELVGYTIPHDRLTVIPGTRET